MTANKVYDINIMEEYGQENERRFMNATMDYGNKVIHDNKVERMLLSSREIYEYMQNRKTQPYTHAIIFNLGKEEIVKTY